MNKLMISIAVGTILVVAAMACGGSDKKSGGGKAGTVNEATVKSSSTSNVTTSTTLITSTDPNAGQSAASQYMAASLSAQGAITPAIGAMLIDTLNKGMGGMAEGTCACEGTKCTFTDCGSDASSKMNGTIDWTGGNIKTDIEFTYMQGGVNYEINVQTDLTVSETQIDGTVSSDGSYDVASVPGVPSGAGSVAWASDLDYNAVTYANGQPSGGSVHFEGSYTIGGQKYSGKSDITYP